MLQSNKCGKRRAELQVCPRRSVPVVLCGWEMERYAMGVLSRRLGKTPFLGLRGVSRPVARIHRSNVAGGGGSGGCRSSTSQSSSSVRKVLVGFMVWEFCRRSAPKIERSTDCLGLASAIREGFSLHKEVICDLREIEHFFIKRSTSHAMFRWVAHRQAARAPAF